MTQPSSSSSSAMSARTEWSGRTCDAEGPREDAEGAEDGALVVVVEAADDVG